MNLISAEIIVRCSPGEVDVQTALLVGDTNVSFVLMRETPKNRDGESTKRTTSHTVRTFGCWFTTKTLVLKKSGKVTVFGF